MTITLHDGNCIGHVTDLAFANGSTLFTALENEFMYGTGQAMRTSATFPLTRGHPRWMPLVDGPSKPGSSRSFDWSKFDVVPPREFHGRLFFDFPPERSVPYSRRSFAGQAEATYYQISFLIGEVWAEQLAIAMANLSQRTRWSHPDLMRVAAATVLRVTRP